MVAKKPDVSRKEGGYPFWWWWTDYVVKLIYLTIWKKKGGRLDFQHIKKCSFKTKAYAASRLYVFQHALDESNVSYIIDKDRIEQIQASRKLFGGRISQWSFTDWLWTDVLQQKSLAMEAMLGPKGRLNWRRWKLGVFFCAGWSARYLRWRCPFPFFFVGFWERHPWHGGFLFGSFGDSGGWIVHGFLHGSLSLKRQKLVFSMTSHIGRRPYQSISTCISNGQSIHVFTGPKLFCLDKGSKIYDGIVVRCNNGSELMLECDRLLYVPAEPSCQATYKRNAVMLLICCFVLADFFHFE